MSEKPSRIDVGIATSRLLMRFPRVRKLFVSDAKTVFSAEGVDVVEEQVRRVPNFGKKRPVSTSHDYKEIFKGLK